MRIIFYIALISSIIAGCELIRIESTRSEPVINIDQSSPVSVVYLFKTELDSNNIPGATEVLAHPDGDKYLAIEQYMRYDEIARIGRIIRDKPVTKYKVDSLSRSKYRVNVVFDYLKDMSFTTKKINDEWYIIEYSELSDDRPVVRQFSYKSDL